MMNEEDVFNFTEAPTKPSPQSNDQSSQMNATTLENISSEVLDKPMIIPHNDENQNRNDQNAPSPNAVSENSHDISLDNTQAAEVQPKATKDDINAEADQPMIIPSSPTKNDSSSPTQQRKQFQPLKILCIGDEFSGSTVSWPWVNFLQARNPYATFTERPYSGVHTRWFLEKIKVERFFYPNYLPDYIFFQMGIHDVLATDQAARSMISFANRLPKEYDFSIDSFEHNVREILQIIKERSYTSKVAVISISPIGEDVKSELNQKVHEYNKVLKRVTEKLGFTYFDFGEQMAQRLEEYYSGEHKAEEESHESTKENSSLKSSEKAEEPTVQAGPRTPPKFEINAMKFLWNADMSILKRVIGGLSWKAQTSQNKTYLTVNNMHLNHTSGMILMNMAQKWLMAQTSQFGVQKKELEKRLKELKATYNHKNWMPDNTTTICVACKKDFGFFARKHHCRVCGLIFCDTCTAFRINETNSAPGERACWPCFQVMGK